MHDERTSREFDGVDLTGARFRKVPLNEARFRMVDLSGVVMRDVSLEGAAIDGEIDGLRINGVDVAPLVEAELTRRFPVRALRRAPDPPGLRASWLAVEDEWSYVQTLRHLVFATDAWLGAVRGDEHPFHPWGLAFTEVGEFVEDTDRLGLDPDARPSYAEVLELRADRAARVREFLEDVTPERLAEECVGPLWEHGERLSVLRCLWVIVNEECEHLRFAERDLDLIEAGAPVT
jgi:hypothetical protein